MIRVELTTNDLLNVSVAEHPAPLLELMTAFMSAQRHDQHPVFDLWRSKIAGTLPVRARPLLELMSPLGAGPRFLDPLTPTFDEGLDKVLATPDTVALAELQRVCAVDRPRTTWVRRLASHDREAWLTLEQAIRSGHDTILANAWPALRAGFYAETAWRARMLARDGLHATLSSLSPAARLRGTTLEIDSPRELTITSKERGIILQPTLLWSGHPLLTPHRDGRNVVIYSAVTPLPMRDVAPSTDPLTALLGATRAQALQLLVRHTTTTQLANELEITPGAASMQAKALRDAGLISSRRDGKAVWHTCTPLGIDLLTNSTAAATG